MKILMDNTDNLKTCFAHNIISYKPEIDNANGKYLCNEILHSSKTEHYFWYLRRTEFDSLQEMENYIFIRKLEFSY